MTAGTPPPATVDFNRDVRPILSDRCFACHGPDAAKRKAGLRLDTQEGASALLESGHRAIVLGDRAASEAAHRILSDDPEEVMPPPTLKRPLTDTERTTLLQWIEEGTGYQRHWAFEAPELSIAPLVKDPAWSRDPLDAFILARLEQEGLAPEPEADRTTLLRRASFALTGLAPTPEEVDAFLADAAPDAYEQRVDAMLASERAAEHRATVWLDLARFADTFGYQSDGDCFTWPWRDWLLEALKSNTRYDRFATALIAGDLVKAESRAQRQSNQIASAFNRLHRMTEEGGSIAEEFRQEGIADRVATFGTAFLGLTIECARCHDHKYDPIPTREFYALAAMFGAIDENGLKSYAHHFSAPPPFVRLENDEQAERSRALLEESTARSEALRAAMLDARTHALDEALHRIDLPTPAARYSFEVLTEGRSPNGIESGAPATTDRSRPEQLGEVTLGDGKQGKSLQFDGDGGVSLAGLAGFTRHDPVSVAFWIKPHETHARATVLHTSGFYTNDADGSGLELLIADGKLRWSVIHLWPGSAASLAMSARLPLDEWTHVVATYDGLSRADGLHLYVNGREAATTTLRDELHGNIASATMELGSRSRDAGFRGGAIDELAVWRLALTPLDAALAAGVIPEDDARIEHQVLHATTTQREALRAAQRVHTAHLDTLSAFMVMRDSPRATPTSVLTRGAYDQPDPAQRVEPGVVSAVLTAAALPARNRLGLAQWLVHADNPLAARVEVNRLWTQVFGRGLVETAENFGLQGSFPTHRAVLDLLAYDLARGSDAWDTNAILRRLVLSASFRQRSNTSAEKLARDPHNDLLSRGPSVRLSAEMLRDGALMASGLLKEQFGGPSVKPAQQANLVADSGANGGYTPDTGDAAHRRSLYTYRKRTVPPPTTLLFDGGSREACQPRRFATNTPLQSLALLNDPIFTECARALAERTMRDAESGDARLVRAFRLVCTREPRADELDALRALVTALRADAATTDEAAILTLVCSTILASDAAVYSR